MFAFYGRGIECTLQAGTTFKCGTSKSQQQLVVMEGHIGEVNSVSLSGDGQLIGVAHVIEDRSLFNARRDDSEMLASGLDFRTSFCDVSTD